jgi:MFS family permease
MTPAAIGLLFGGATIAYGVVSPAAGAASDRWGRRPLMAAGLALTAVTLPLLVLPQHALLASAALVLVAVAYGVSQTPTLPELGDAVDQHGGGGYATVYALFNGTYSVGMMAGPIAGAALAGAVGLPTAFALIGAVLLAYVPVLLVRTRKTSVVRLPAADSGGTGPPVV